jgi:hypothetical protein
MSPPRWPVFPKDMIDVPGNDSRHNLPDRNHGGSPRDAGKNMPLGQRGGFTQNGRDKVVVRASMSGARGGSGNPASRGGARIGSMQPEARIPGHGGSPQHKGGAGSGADFGRPGQKGVPGGKPTHGPAGAGNTQGLAYRRIAGRFKRAAMGAKATSDSGKYGSPPVSANT